MKLLLLSILALTACARESPNLQLPIPCKEAVAKVTDTAAPTVSAVNRDTLAFVRLGYGDSHDLAVRSLNFRTECLSTSIMQEALRLVPEYNNFDGAKVADDIEKLRGEVMCWQFGREGSPVIYMQVPYWLGQAESACPQRHDGEATPCDSLANDRRLSQTESDALSKRATELFRRLHADEVEFDRIANNTLRIWWD